MLVKYATAFIIMPGGLGTLDELTEVLTLMQTHKIKPFPVILFNSDYWKGLTHWIRNGPVEAGTLSQEDMEIFQILDDPEEVIKAIRKVVVW